MILYNPNIFYWQHLYLISQHVTYYPPYSVWGKWPHHQYVVDVSALDHRRRRRHVSFYLLKTKKNRINLNKYILFIFAKTNKSFIFNFYWESSGCRIEAGASTPRRYRSRYPPALLQTNKQLSDGDLLPLRRSYQRRVRRSLCLCNITITTYSPEYVSTKVKAILGGLYNRRLSRSLEFIPIQRYLLLK